MRIALLAAMAASGRFQRTQPARSPALPLGEFAFRANNSGNNSMSRARNADQGMQNSRNRSDTNSGSGSDADDVMLGAEVQPFSTNPTYNPRHQKESRLAMAGEEHEDSSTDDDTDGGDDIMLMGRRSGPRVSALGSRNMARNLLNRGSRGVKTVKSSSKPASRRCVGWVAVGTLLALVVAVVALGLVASKNFSSAADSNEKDSSAETSPAASDTLAARVGELEELVAQLKSAATAKKSPAVRISDLEARVAELRTQLNTTAAVLATAEAEGVEMQAQLVNATATVKTAQVPTILAELASECEQYGDFLGLQTLQVVAEGSVVCHSEPVPTKLVAGDGSPEAGFGYAVAAGSAGLVVVGARNANAKGEGSGAVYVYRMATRKRTPPHLIAKLVADDAEAHDNFGASVAVSVDGLIVAGAFADGDGKTYYKPGSAYVFRASADDAPPHFVGKIVPDDSKADDYFGSAVAAGVDGLVVVGGPRNAEKGLHSGAVYLYRVNAANKDTPLELLTKLLADDGAQGDEFGVSVALGGGDELLVVGAPGSGHLKGAAYLYRLDAKSARPQLLTKLEPDASAQPSSFGISVAISAVLSVDSLLAVGAYHGDDNGKDSGTAYVYFLGQSAPAKLAARLVPADGAVEDYFGRSVAVGADGLVLAAAFYDDDKGSNSGSVSAFRVRGDEPLQVLPKLVPADGSANDQFGVAIAIGTDGLVIVGAHGASDMGPGSGSAYAYHPGAPPS